MLQRRELSASTKLRGRKLRGAEGASPETPGALRGVLGSLDLILPGMGTSEAAVVGGSEGLPGLGWEGRGAPGHDAVHTQAGCVTFRPQKLLGKAQLQGREAAVCSWHPGQGSRWMEDTASSPLDRETWGVGSPCLLR